MTAILGISAFYPDSAAAITPAGLLMRVPGRDPMDREIDRCAKSCWIEQKPQCNIGHYFRQFCVGVILRSVAPGAVLNGSAFNGQ